MNDGDGGATGDPSPLFVLVVLVLHFVCTHNGIQKYTCVTMDRMPDRHSNQSTISDAVLFPGWRAKHNNLLTKAGGARGRDSDHQ